MPISNTMVESHTLSRYLDPKGLVDRGRTGYGPVRRRKAIRPDEMPPSLAGAATTTPEPNASAAVAVAGIVSVAFVRNRRDQRLIPFGLQPVLY